ncbi:MULTISPECIES: hypothetical protein [unclassified Leeuwenhoekiella]|uniref:hypothetical protein n=1 Tax=unclassified Leeuwenhoekiella TaxID=2615029 RepID=UPI000C58957F|nr:MULTISPECIES: hypothetical protein [unclassified Leeuwenhoekiella]MBA82570.1 hypothetical protein [Leeuwenhoekiella sp.]|tara:strand:- start:51950 stop:52180 length:231 start_codon:yes stop_codon:yes gene_type:complete
MKKAILFLTLSISTFVTFSCREAEDKEKETVIVREVEVEKPEVEREGILERTAKKVDQEVNKEIDQEIDNIGDDNK